MFTRFTNWCAYAVGTPLAFILSLLLVIVWALVGPLFGWSTTHQLLINTATTIGTWWLVFVIQNTQNRSDTALHLKLDEIIRSIDEADDAYRGIESKPVNEMNVGEQGATL